MAQVIDDSIVEPVIGVLRGAIDLGDDGTAEQRAVLRAVVTGCTGRTDLEPADVTALGPDEAARAITDPASRRRTRELLVLLELCRHPLTEAQVARVDGYATALAEDGPGLSATRDLVRAGAATAASDMRRFIAGAAPAMEEATLRGFDATGSDPGDDAALGRRLRDPDERQRQLPG